MLTPKQKQIVSNTPIDADARYPVTYTIDHSGEKHPGLTTLLGADMTERQIYLYATDAHLDHWPETIQ